MTTPDIQYFAEDGTWRKPAGAIRVDALVCAGGGGATAGRDGEDGHLATWSRAAAEVGEEIDVKIEKGGRGFAGRP